MKIPIHNRTKEITCYALIDKDDYKKISKISWSLQATGYPQGWYKGYVRTMHQVILNLEPGYRLKDIEAEHINQNKLDNRKKNLRIGNRTTNSRNQHKPQNNSTTGYLNVHKLSNGYQVRIFGKYYGFFTDLDKAGKFAKRKRKIILNTL